jgi:hypothetical protein
MRELVETGGLENHCTAACGICNALETKELFAYFGVNCGEL